MPIAPGTLALYEFENNFLDSSGNGYTALQIGTVPFVTTPTPPSSTYAVGQFSALDYLTTPPAFTLVFQGATNWTLTGQIYLASNTTTSSGFTIFDGTDYIGVQFGTGGDMRIFSSVGGFMLAASAPGTVTTGIWYDFALTYDGTDMKGYVFPSGGSSSTPVVTLTASAAVPVGALINMGILFVGAELPLTGYLDNARFMNNTQTSFPVTDPPAGGAVATEARSRRMSA